MKLNNRSGQHQQHPRSLTDRIKAEDQLGALDSHARLLLAFEFCSHFDWVSARTAIDETRQRFQARGIESSDQAGRVLLYLDAMCKQAQGDLEGALSNYQSPELSFDADARSGNVEKDFRVLSALSSTMILCTLGSTNVDKANAIHSKIEAYCLNHPNGSIKAAYFMTKATANDSRTTIIKTKQYLHSVSTTSSVNLWDLDSALTLLGCSSGQSGCERSDSVPGDECHDGPLLPKHRW